MDKLMISSLKKEIRKDVLNRRDSLTVREIRDKSTAVFEKITRTEWFLNSANIMCFVSFGSEVSTREFLKLCLEKGKRLAVPQIINTAESKRKMIAVNIHNVDSDLTVGYYGILEPKAGIGKIMEPDEFDCIVVPGVAFDSNRYRIGYGGGYYDSFLKGTTESCVKAGVAYDLQIYPSIPVEEHDLPVDMVYTENRIL